MRRGLAAAVVLAACGTALAHGGGVLDLEALEAHVASQAASATGPVRRAYTAVGRALGREIRRPLVDEIGKLRAVEAACARRLGDDAALRSLLAAASDEADAALDGKPEGIEAILSKLERPADRRGVQSLSARAAEDHAAGDDRAALGDEAGRLRLYARAALRYFRAAADAQRLLVRQARRGAPGQPVAKGPRGTIDTYAGSGASAAGSEGLPALVAPFYAPQDVAIDPATGLVHVADLNNHRIRRIDADARVRTVAGNGTGFTEHPFGPAREADLHHPAGIAFHPATGELFIAAWHQSRVLRVDGVTGETVHVAGSGDLGFAGDEGPVADAVLDYPVSLVFASDGTWYVADQGNRRVRRVDGATETITTIAGDGTTAVLDLAPGRNPGEDLTEPAGRIALSPDERTLYVADTGHRRVLAIDLAVPGFAVTAFAGTGAAGNTGDGGPATLATFLAPVDVDCDAQGNVFVCDRDAGVVRRVDSFSRAISTVAGTGVRGNSGDGGPAVAARLDLPSGICVDRVRGRLYVADSGNHVVRVVWE